jgi:hypothetical protein
MPTVEVRGPLFSGAAKGIIDGAIKASIRELVAESETMVKVQLYPGHGLVTGHYRRSIHGEIIDSRHGRVNDSKVIYGPWLEGTGSRNTGRFKGYSMFRKTVQTMRRRAPGFVQKHVARMVKGLNG